MFQISQLFNYSCIYYFIRLLKKKVKMKEEEISFLISNGVNKKRIIRLVSKEQRKLINVCFFISAFFITIINYSIFKEIFINWLMYLYYLFLIVLGNYYLTKLFLNRRIRVC